MQLEIVLLGLAEIVYFNFLILLLIILSSKARLWLKNDARYEDNLHILVLFRQILVFIFPVMLCWVIFGNEFVISQLTSLFVLGLSINVFWLIQLPLMTKAKLYIDFSVDDIKDFKKTINLKTDTEHVIYTRIYNLGFHTLKNALILIYFKEGFEIVPYNDPKYDDLDFKKIFTVQKCNYGAAFSPHQNFQTLPPKEWFLFPLIVKTPKRNLDREIEIQLHSENSWGLTKYPAKVETVK